MALLSLTMVMGSAVSGAEAADRAVPPRVDRDYVLSLAQWKSFYPDMQEPIFISLRSHLFAPRGCDDMRLVVHVPKRSSLLASVSPSVRPHSLDLANQNVVRMPTKSAARALVNRYRHYGRDCIGNEHTDDGEGGAVLLKTRPWDAPRIGDQSAGYLVGWYSGGTQSWRRVIAVRVGRLVTVLDVDFADVRPPAPRVAQAARSAADRLG